MSVKTADLYLMQISDSIESIRNYTSECSKDIFCNDAKTIDAVLMQIIVIGECTTKLLATDFCEKYPSIPWEQIKGMRNLIAHDYARVKPEIVWDTVNVIKDKFHSQLKTVIKNEKTKIYNPNPGEKSIK